MYFASVQQNFTLQIGWKRKTLEYSVEVLWRTQSLVRFKVQYNDRYYILNYMAAQKSNKWKIHNHTFRVKHPDDFMRLTNVIFAALENEMKPPRMPRIDPKNNDSPATRQARENWEQKIQDWHRNDYWTK